MISENDPAIEPRHAFILTRIKAQGVENWLNKEKTFPPGREALVYLCKFGFFTGLLTKAQIGGFLELDKPGLRVLVKSWYDDHRAKGCGTC